jgi:hypothetical protein
VSSNPNYPLMQTLWCPQGHIGYGSGYISYEDMPWVDLSAGGIGNWRTQRGRKYEINQQQSGTGTTSWDNRPGNFDPANTSGVYWPNVLPYRAYRRRAQWPLGGVNLLTIDQATSGEGFPWGPGCSPSVFGIDFAGGFSEWQVVASASAYQGTQVMETTVTQSPGQSLFATRISVLAGQAYSFQIHMRCLTTGQNPQYQAFITWCTPGGTALSTATGTAGTLTGGGAPSWTNLTVSGTAPAGAAYANIGATPVATVSSVQLQGDGLQWEANSSPSAFAVPSPWYNLITGGVERYPQSWITNGKPDGISGKVNPTITDSLALLSQNILGDPLTNAIFTPSGGQGPSFAYLLGDPSNTGTFADATGTRSLAEVTNSAAGAGTITPGTPQTAGSPSGLFQGAPGATVTNFTTTAPAGTNIYGEPMSWVSLPSSRTGAIGPGSGTGLGFMRMLAFRCTTTPTVASVLWVSQDSTETDVVNMLLLDGSLCIQVEDANNTGTLALGAYDLDNWHLAWLGVNAAGTGIVAGIDGAVATYSPTATYNPTRGFSVDQLGAQPAGPGSPGQGLFNFVGDLAFAVEWPFTLSSAQVQAVYNSWKTAYSGQTSGQRYAQILQWAGWTGPTAIDTGSSLSLGPATSISGLDALTCLQQVVDTEAGNHYVDVSGRITFKSRASRYNPGSAVYTFGEDTGAGEYPYEQVDYDDDPTLLCTVAQVTQQSTNQVFTAQNAAAQAQFGSPTRQITNLSTSAQECQDQATYVVSRYDTPVQRVNGVTLHPAADASLWPVALSLEIGTLVAVNRRPPSPAALIPFKGWVENIAWAGSKSDATVTVQMSPVDATPYAQFAALHTKLYATGASGQPQVVLGALADAATNSFSSYVFSGMQITLDPGTTLSETLTVQSVSATSPGYTTVTITFTGNLAYTHSSGAVACEALPALSSTTYTNAGTPYTPPGPTNPAMWDNSMFGSVTFAY